MKEKGLAPGAVCAAMNVLCYRTCFGPQADILASDMSKNAPVVIDWYRSPLPTALFKKLHERSDAKAWFQTGGYLLIMLSMALLFDSATLACEKHLKGHQSSVETQAEGVGRLSHPSPRDVIAHG